MKYMLDTNICIFIIKNKHESVLAKLKNAINEGICISSITLAELEHGVALSVYPSKNSEALLKFLSLPAILPFDAKAASKYGMIRADLQKKGALIGQMDLLIAAHAMANSCVLATNNKREFDRIVGLTVEDWVNQ